MKNIHEVFRQAQRSISPETIFEAHACVERAMKTADEKITKMDSRAKSKPRPSLSFHWISPGGCHLEGECTTDNLDEQLKLVDALRVGIVAAIEKRDNP